MIRRFGPAHLVAELGAIGILAAAALPPRRQAYPNPSVLAEPADVRGRLGDPGLVLLDGRGQAAYDAGHIPGARWVGAARWEKLAARPGGLRDATAWSDLLDRLGINAAKEVVVYSDDFRTTARIWWLLRYLGVERSRILNGGWDWWRNHHLPTTTEAPRVTPTTFRVHFQARRLADKDYLLRAIHSGSAAVCDARSRAEYTGSRNQARRGGHIPTAHRLEWKDLLDPDGRVKPAAELRRLIARAGIEPGKPAVTYCQSGGRAAADALVLELMGYPDVRNYYASWREWGNAPDTPIER